ncbi:MAG TPA: sulfur carrier protein ThiS [Spirochaetes bacterium]|nr:sulfur carrier protein ThiS [Spirochaetota bacterium]
MNITVNFREIEFDGATLGELLKLYRFDPLKIRVEINGEIVPSARYADMTLNEGDVLDIDRA